VTEIDLRDSRAEDVQPGGFVPSHLAEPALRDMRPTTAEYAKETLGGIRIAADLIAGGGLGKRRLQNLALHIGEEAARLQRLLAAGALVLALAVAAVVAGPSVGRAEAMEAPQPDPVAVQTVRVPLGAVPVTVYVRANVYTPVARGWYCGSVYGTRGRIGGTCSISASFPIPVTIDPRAFPVGRSFAQVVDDATDVAVGNVTFDARRGSAWGRSSTSAGVTSRSVSRSPSTPPARAGGCRRSSPRCRCRSSRAARGGSGRPSGRTLRGSRPGSCTSAGAGTSSGPCGRRVRACGARRVGRGRWW
jgi:hypothetical protein